MRVIEREGEIETDGRFDPPVLNHHCLYFLSPYKQEGL